MIYLDTNILIYAFLKNIDNQEQKEKSIALLREALSKKALLISEITLYEFAFVSKKLKEDEKNINEYLKFLSKFTKSSNKDIENRTLEIISKTFLYQNSFDTFHLAFSEFYNCKKLFTFDKGFKKFKTISKVDIEIL